MYKEYKVVHIAEGGCGTLLLGSAGLPLKKIESRINLEASEGWQVVCQVIENKRFLYPDCLRLYLLTLTDALWDGKTTTH